MATTETSTTSKLELMTAYGPVYRDVLDNPPRDCRPEEIPVIDLTALWSDRLEERKALALRIRSVGINTGFFYIQNHGISDHVIVKARRQATAFFHQSVRLKQQVSQARSRYFNGWAAPKTSMISRAEKADGRESFSWRYGPEHDPQHPRSVDELPESARPYIRAENFVWEGTAQLPQFQDDCLEYWKACLTLARKLARVFALALELPEDYFDSRVTHPGADGVFNFYSPPSAQDLKDNSVGLGSHTDLQMFTLLWQDENGGLQVLNNDGQWIRAPPVPGTLVVNIGDFMMRLSNDLFRSTVHRVYNRAPVERLSMPFFFGLNFDCVQGVLPTCADETNPPRYEPISCGDWCQMRFAAQAERARKELGTSDLSSSSLSEKAVPAGRVVAAA